MADSGLEMYVTVPLGILSVLIVITNISVCALVCLTKTLRTYTNWLIVSLAVSDILTGGVLLPLILIKPESINMSYFNAIILTSGVANICAVTYDRYVAITKPLHYPYRAPNIFKRAIIVAWLIPTIYSLLPLIWDTDMTLTVHVVYLVCLEVLGVVVPYIFITVAYVRIFKQVRRSLRMRREFESASEQRKERARISSDAQVAKVFCIISTTFLLSWLPVLYITTAYYVLNQPEIVPETLLTVSFFPMASGSLVNPLVYAFLKPDFKSIIRNFCRKSTAIDAASMTHSVPTPLCQAGKRENTRQRDETEAKTEDNSPNEEYDTYL